jgi:hypothetical protein
MLLGYLFQLLASSVMLITVIQFYAQQEKDEQFVTKWDTRIYTSVNNHFTTGNSLDVWPRGR